MATQRKTVQLRGTAKREAILSAAWGVFRDVGFPAASMDEVTRRAGGSKVSLYAHFGNKTALFEAVVRWRAELVAHTYSVANARARNIEEALTALATAIFAGMASTAVQDLHRVALSAQPGNKDVGKLLYKHGTLRVVREAAAVIERGMRSGELKADDPLSAAESLFGLLLGTDYIRFALGVPVRLTTTARRQRVARAVSIFLTAYQMDKGAKGQASF